MKLLCSSKTPKVKLVFSAAPKSLNLKFHT